MPRPVAQSRISGSQIEPGNRGLVVSILEYEALKRTLGIPRPIKVVAYLCLGYVEEFMQRPDLEQAGQLGRLPVVRLI